VAGGDIGINWLPDDDWSRGKCGLRVLQYMAAGLPVVANPVGMNREMVVDGRTGFLASTPGQWADAVARLAADPALRRRMGAEGRRLVQKRFSVEVWGSVFAEMVAQIARQRPTSDRCVPAGVIRLENEQSEAEEFVGQAIGNAG
jgi:glycosyltransferase involved in cell wall biosynthesis